MIQDENDWLFESENKCSSNCFSWVDLKVRFEMKVGWNYFG